MQTQLKPSGVDGLRQRCQALEGGHNRAVVRGSMTKLSLSDLSFVSESAQFCIAVLLKGKRTGSPGRLPDRDGRHKSWLGSPDALCMRASVAAGFAETPAPPCRASVPCHAGGFAGETPAPPCRHSSFAGETPAPPC